MNYEWDELKNRSNVAKHRIDFSYAICVFDDKDRVEFEDCRHHYGELRFKTIGKIEGRLFTVIYTYRHGFYRIISARKARKGERQDYLRN